MDLLEVNYSKPNKAEIRLFTTINGFPEELDENTAPGYCRKNTFINKNTRITWNPIGDWPPVSFGRSIVVDEGIEYSNDYHFDTTFALKGGDKFNVDVNVKLEIY